MGQKKKCEPLRLEGIGVERDHEAFADPLGVYFVNPKSKRRGLLVFWGDLRTLMTRDPGPQDFVSFEELLSQVRFKP